MIEVRRFENSDSEIWDQFVEGSNNGTLFHTRKFLSYHPPDRFLDHSLLFYKKGKLTALLPAAIQEGDRLISHPGASFGGFVVKKDINLRTSFDLVKALLNYAQEQKIQKLDLTLPPIFYSYKINHYLDFALFRLKFGYRKREVSSFVTLDFNEDEVLRVFKSEARTAVRRAQKLGVQVRKSDDLAAFYTILKKNLKLRHNVTPTHTLSEMEKLHQLFPEQIELFGAFLEERMIAGVVLFHCNPLVTLAFYISHNEEFQRYRGVNILFYEIFRYAVRRGFRYLDFGIFTVNMEPNWGLAHFKENFGSKGIFRDSFEIQL